MVKKKKNPCVPTTRLCATSRCTLKFYHEYSWTRYLISLHLRFLTHISAILNLHEQPHRYATGIKGGTLYECAVKSLEVNSNNGASMC